MWSLSVEEQFYLIWPLILLVILRFADKRSALGVTILLIGIVVLHRCFAAQGIDPHDPQLFWRTDTRADSLLVGCALALAASLGWKGSRRFWKVGAIANAFYILLLLPTSFNTGTWNYTFGYTVLALAAAVIIGAVAMGTWLPMTRALSWKPLASLGRISYAVYLWHFPIAVLLPLRQGPVPAVATLILAILAAVLSWHWVERPAPRWRSPRARLQKPAAPSVVAA